MRHLDAQACFQKRTKISKDFAMLAQLLLRKAVSPALRLGLLHLDCHLQAGAVLPAAGYLSTPAQI